MIATTRKVLLMVFLTCHWLAFSQVPTQSIKGRITDKNTLQTMPGANVYIFQGDSIAYGGTSDIDGNYKFENVPVGRHFVFCTFIGYEGWKSGYIELTSAKELVLNIQLIESAITADAVVITAKKMGSEPLNEFVTLSARSFNVEETQRFAGSINDPGRMALSLPGVQFSAQDNENTIVVRGNSPLGVLWRLEGADIVNPNHFPDKSSSGGGISALSIYVLGVSDFMAGTMPNQFSNALAGAMDLNFRKGNSEEREYRIQAGMIGLEFATEGPFSKKNKKSSYLVNYRYSTLGLLNSMGIRIVSPNVSNVFQDLSFNLYFPSGKKGIINVYGLGGLSNEKREPVADPNEWEYYRDKKQYDYNTRLGVAGLSYTHLTSANSYLRLTLSASANEITWNEDTVNIQGDPGQIKNEHFNNGKYVLAASYNGKFSNSVNYSGGLNISNLVFDVFANRYDAYTGVDRTNVTGNGTTWYNQAYFQTNYRITPSTTLRGGITLVYYAFNQQWNVEPRIELSQYFGKRNKISLAYANTSQIVPFTSSYTTATDQVTGQITGFPNLDLPLMKSHYFNSGLALGFSDFLVLKIEPYYQFLYNVPASLLPQRSFWLLNAGDEFEVDPLEATGEGRNYGMDISLEKYFANQLFFILNTSLFTSNFSKGKGSPVYPTRYASDLIASFTTGKEWQLQNGNTFEAGLKFLYSDGLRYTPIDEGMSEMFRRTIEIQDQAFANKTIYYFRMDLRISYRKNLPTRSWKLSLDIQNATNRVNEERPEYDFLLQKVIFDPQSSIIPIISYTLDF